MHEATLRLLARQGLTFGMEQLAQEAGVHKTTLYRRWETPAELVGEVAAELISSGVRVPDTGSLEGDLHSFAADIAAVVSHPLYGPAMVAVFTAPASFPEIADVIRRFWAQRIPALAPMVERAVVRGELPADTDPGLLFEALGAPLYYRLFLTRQPVDAAAVDRAVNATMAAAQAGTFAGRPTAR